MRYHHVIGAAFDRYASIQAWCLYMYKHNRNTRFICRARRYDW